MKKLMLSLLGLLTFTTVHAQQMVVIERHGIFTDLATAAGAIVALPFAAVEGIVVGTVEAAGSLIHGSTQIIVAPPARTIPASIIVAPAPVMVTSPVIVTPAPVAVTPVSPAPVTLPCVPAAIPTTTIITTHSDGTVTTVTRQASAYEIGPVIVAPVSPSHCVGSSQHVNHYVYRHR